ncbi:MAG: hypothetical protein E6G80_19340, partial [Alphaproteobacteria bacterium]
MIPQWRGPVFCVARICGASRWLPHGDWPNVLEAHLRDALLKLRDEVGKVLTNKANELKHQLARLEGETGNRGRHSSLNGRKVAVKYRDGSANAWAGRGAQPVWLREKLKAGAKLEDFAVHKSVAARNVSPKKPKTRRRAKVAGGARRAPKAKRRPILTAAPDEQP